jgi:hypothetical protein
MPMLDRFTTLGTNFFFMVVTLLVIKQLVKYGLHVVLPTGAAIRGQMMCVALAVGCSRIEIASPRQITGSRLVVRNPAGSLFGFITKHALLLDSN